MERFNRIDDKLSDGTLKIMNRKSKKSDSEIGDFLSRLWRIYGEPKTVGFEGFTYTFKDKETGLIFTAYSAGSGTSYGGIFEEKERLIPILNSFDKMLNSVEPINCEIKFKTDFGTLRSGSKNGVPFDQLSLNFFEKISLLLKNIFQF